MAIASSDGRRRRKLAYKVKSSSNGSSSHGSVFAYSIFSCVDDVERHRHRRNPFDPKYIQAALSSFEELGQDGSRSVATREDLEAASTSVHVRTELIKSMKDGLMKLTTEAIKCCGAGTKKTHKKRLSMPEMEVDNSQIGTVQREKETPDMSKQDDYEVYKRIFGKSIGNTNELPSSVLKNKSFHGRTDKVYIGLALVMKELEACMNGNPNLVTDDEICFNLKKENMETLPEMLQRLQPDCETVAISEDGYADLSAYKGFICPVTMELVLDFEDNKTHRNIEESRLQANEAGAKPAMNVEGGSIQNVNNHVMVPVSVIEEHCVMEKSVDTLDRVGCITESHVQKTMNALEHSPFYEGSIEIFSEDIVMEESIIVEEVEDDIEDIEEIQERIEPEQIQDDVDKKVAVNIRDVPSVLFTISNAEIARLLQHRQESKRSKHPWLVSDPEKLLLPDSNGSGCSYDICDLESRIESCVLDGMDVFNQSLSRPGMDIVERYNSMRNEPTQVVGTLHFELMAEEEDDNFSPGISSTDDQEVEDAYMDQDQIQGFSTGTCEPATVERSSRLGVSREEYQQSRESCWENYTWSMSSGKRHPGMELKPASGGNIKHFTYISQHTDVNDYSYNAPPIVLEKENLSPILQMGGNCEGDTNARVNAAFVGHNVISWGSLNHQKESIELVDCVKERHDDSCNQHARQTLEKVMLNSLQKKEMIDQIKDGKASVQEEHDRTGQNDQRNIGIDGASQSICLLDGGTRAVEAGSVPWATEIVNQDNDSIDMLPIYSLNTALRMDDVIEHPHAFSGSLQSTNVQTFKSVKEKRHLDELITDAVMAECQLQETTYSHYDLEPLSQLLSSAIASIFGRRNEGEIMFKDLVTTCFPEQTNARESVTPQRCFIALLSLAHRHNIGNSKNSGIKDSQISIRGACAGKLDEIVVHLVPLVCPNANLLP